MPLKNLVNATPEDLSGSLSDVLRIHPSYLAIEDIFVSVRSELVFPSPATHAILAQLKAGETVYQPGELPEAFKSL